MDKELVMIFFSAVALIIFCIGACIYYVKFKKSKKVQDRRRAFWGVVVVTFISVFILCLPISIGYGLGGVFNSIHTTMGTFALETGMSDFMDACNEFIYGEKARFNLPVITRITVWLLFLAAPILTATFFLSLARKFLARIRFANAKRKSTLYCFSELNRETISLARNIMKENEDKKRIVFYGVDNDEMEDSPLIEDAQDIGAIFISYDMAQEQSWKLRAGKSLYWICASKDPKTNKLDDKENIECALDIKKRFDETNKKVKYREIALTSDEADDKGKGRGKSEEAVLFVLAADSASELIFASLHSTDRLTEDERSQVASIAGNTKEADERAAEIILDRETSKMIIRRKDPAMTLVWNYVYEHPEHIFSMAQSRAVKDVDAVVIGGTREAREMVHVLSWLTQIPGFHLHLDVFDSDPKAIGRYKADSPEMILQDKSLCSSDTGVSYEINIHSGVDYQTSDLHDAVRELNSSRNVDFVFISTDDTDVTIRTAMSMRNVLGDAACITAVVKDIDDLALLNDACHVKSEKCWNINFIGAPGEVYNKDLLFGSRLEEEGAAVNLSYSKGAGPNVTLYEKSRFRRSEYSYRSSCASALSEEVYRKLRLENCDEYEHIRWNAYMLSSGWGGPESKSRFLVHNDIVKYAELSPEEKKKDENIVNSGKGKD